MHPKRLLVMSVREAILMQQLNYAVDKNKHLMEMIDINLKVYNKEILRLSKSIPKKHIVQGWVAEAMESKIELFDASRESAIKHLARLRDAA